MLALVLPAAAVTLSLRSSETVESGVTVETYRSSSPSTDLYAARIDLCAAGVYVEATRAPDDTQSTGSWANDQGVAFATNGDFYKTGPVRVYGDAVGGGVRWPSEQTGLDTDYADEWYYEHHGWIAFLHDGVAYTHTGWVKENAGSFGTLGGWAPTEINPDPPPGTLALVSGFPELVVEGRAMTCADPEASSCFPDRSDMRDRHPRTAMGITEDGETLLLVVADGRTSSTSGLYGSELADVMAQLGAYVAFNLDGGGSSQMWAGGYVNDYDGNNSGSGARSVANHWGVFAGAMDFLPDRPGHCARAAVCEAIPRDGATLDNTESCFRGFGDQAYWRRASGGVNGTLQWTNAFRSDTPDNWAWWRLELEADGEYLVEVSSDATYSVRSNVRYEVRADGESHEVWIDPRGGGWHTLGTYTFAAGGEQWVAVFDNEASSPGSDQHIVADAVRLTRVCCDDPVDTGGSGDTGGAGDDTAPDGDDTGRVDTGAPDSGARDTGSPGPGGAPGALVPMPTGGCGCGDGGGAALIGVLLAASGMRRRR